MWRCASCGESIEASLDVCWYCGTSRNGERDAEFKRADEFLAAEAATLEAIDAASLRPDAPKAPPPIPKIKFGLRFLLAALAFCSLVFAVFAWDLHPKTAADFWGRGLRHLRHGAYEDAVADLTRALELLEETNDASRPSIHAARAVAYSNVGRPADAVDDISEAIDGVIVPWESADFNPFGNGKLVFVSEETLVGWIRFRARAYLSLGEFEKATADLKVVLEHDPEDVRTQRMLASAKSRQK